MRTETYSYPEPEYEKIDRVDWARLAAFIDGEGSISIVKRSSKKGAPAQYSIRIIVTNTEPELIKWLQATFGGSVASFPRTNGWKTIHRWNVACRKAAKILRYCLPYFILKTAQAGNALALQNLITGAKREGPGRFFSQEQWDARHALFERAKELKQAVGK